MRTTLEASHYFIPVDLSLLRLCVEVSTQDTWAKIQLLIAHGASNGNSSNWMETAFLSLKHSNSILDYFQTVCGLLRSGVDIDAKDGRGLTLCDLLQEGRHWFSGSLKLDLLHCAAEREAQCDSRLPDWVLEHPREPSVYNINYTPFHHLQCHTKPNHAELVQTVTIDWQDQCVNGFWPGMTPEEEHTVAHGSYVERRINDRAGKPNAWTRWSSSGEVFICDLGGELDEVVERKTISFPCIDCIARWLHDTGSSRPQDSNDKLHLHHSVRFVATSIGGTWDLGNNMDGYPTYAWVLMPSSEWSRYRQGGVNRDMKTVHVPRPTKVSHSDIDMQQDHEDTADDTSKRRARTMSSSSNDDKTFRKSKVEHNHTSASTRSVMPSPDSNQAITERG